MLTLRVGNSQDIKAEYGSVDIQKTFSELGGYIGRSADCHWSLNDHSRKISGKHMLLESQYGEFFITDVSTNGTKLNGLKFERNSPTKIKQGDVIELGLYKLMVASISKNDVHSDIGHIVNNNVTKSTSASDSLSFLEEENLAGNNSLPFENASVKQVHQTRDPFEQLRVNSDFTTDMLDQSSSQSQEQLSPIHDFASSTSEEASLEDLAHVINIGDVDQDFDFPDTEQSPVNTQSEVLEPVLNQQQVHQNIVRSQERAQPESTSRPQPVQTEREQLISEEDPDIFLKMLCQKIGLSYNVINQIDRNKIYTDVIDILSYSIDGLIRLMMERNNAKNKLDSDLTMFTSQVKNPFKMSMSSKQALETVLFDTNSQIMPARQAVGESISEIISHFKKVDASTREVVELMVNAFDPEKVEQEVSQAGRVIPGTLSTKCWNKHKVKYVQMLGTTDKQKKKNVKEYISEKYNQSN